MCPQSGLVWSLSDVYSAQLILNSGRLPGIFTASPLCVCESVCVHGGGCEKQPSDVQRTEVKAENMAKPEADPEAALGEGV